MLDALVNKPNTIHARQQAFQKDTRHVFQKTPRARLYMVGFMSLFAIGTLGITQGAYKLATGKK
ncbi:uncharacterized protein RHOBADRAFT_65861 [Rhodotorula graminis WP1]|uniref:Uncharacterized protein n=1 Tax=Rhodotorula graminis (strain WP1) TaxID=578459 RepID=A0A194SCF4_RHOGW|nr:uncharacterized protein RHOBADRAFT_65861 [Rhodotorula graminis WP1]KPV78125.1 hypothetical protein RHOBADRAFT_65861 [Rhodotorula graminis WP1]